MADRLMDEYEARQHAPQAPRRDVVTEAGFYEHDGAVYKVQVAVHGSGRLYAKRLDTATGRFEYVAGALRALSADERMSLDQAAALGRLYGRCVVCGRTLTDEDSIEAGIGPICAKGFGS
jgi:hypothetical protein